MIKFIDNLILIFILHFYPLKYIWCSSEPTVKLFNSFLSSTRYLPDAENIISVCLLQITDGNKHLAIGKVNTSTAEYYTRIRDCSRIPTQMPITSKLF
ncbi:hypothetical protein ACTXT7_011404 [Hymenolepis weldensis]